jgi:SAM-dependent methyltransferase
MDGLSRWQRTDAPRGDDYDDRWRSLAANGAPIHGEADLVEAIVDECGVSRSVLDAGCGTGRVAIELAARGFDAVGADLDLEMLGVAQRKAPQLAWHATDLATLDLGRRFGAAVLAGNVMIFVAPGTEGGVLARLAAHLEPDGVLIAGFQIRADRWSLLEHDRSAEAAGFELAHRYATWDRDPYAGGDYAVSVHRRR